MIKRLSLTIILIITLQGVYAQFSKDDPRGLGDKAFNNKDYYEAAYYYRKAAEGMSLITQQAVPYTGTGQKTKKGKPEDQAYISYQLGESYRGYENYLEAEPWYYKVLTTNNEGKYPLARLWYGVCLRANQHFDESIKQLEQFNLSYKGDAKYNAVAKKEIQTCLFAKEQYKYPIMVDVAKRKGLWNSDGSDYAMLQRDGFTYFTSSRFTKNDKKHLNRVYRVANAGNGDPEVIKFPGDDKISELEYGTPSFSPDGQRMYFTRWFKVGSKTTYAIYCSEYKSNQWSSPQKLNSNVNVDGFNSIQPSVTTDGKKMFFTSTKPGGLGGDDIWVSDLDGAGNPVNSKNLGKSINTSLDEQGAYYDIPNKRLIYSSKGYLGLGGFDFFESNYDGDSWSAARNMGYPMNSAKDDLYYMPDKQDANKFYISSDRESDCCLNLFEVLDKRYSLTGLVTDCDTHKALAGVKVSFMDSLTKQTVKQLTLDKSGKYVFDVTTRRPLSMNLEKPGYFTKVMPVPATGKMSNDTLFNPEICLQAFKVDKPIVINNVLYDYDKATLRPQSKEVLNGLVTILKDNPKIRIELASHTDSKGGDAYNNRLSYKRAKACVDYIISMGVDEARVYAKGYGERRPIAPNTLPNGKDNPTGRQLNRRTEFTVLKFE